MLLTVDIGNRFLKWGVWRDHGLCATGRFDPADPAAWEQLHGIPVPDRAIVGCVGNRTWQTNLAERAQRLWGISTSIARSTAECSGLRNGYVQPERLGVDRWAALVGAWMRWRRPLCVADTGTAITVDVVDSSGRHEGGLIAPGLDLMRDSLQRNTRNVRTNDRAAGAMEWGQDTESCVEAGIRRSAAGLVSEACGRWRAQHGDRTLCVITGGDARIVSSVATVPLRHEPHLVLEGLMHLYMEGGVE